MFKYNTDPYKNIFPEEHMGLTKVSINTLLREYKNVYLHASSKSNNARFCYNTSTNN